MLEYNSNKGNQNGIEQQSPFNQRQNLLKDASTGFSFNLSSLNMNDQNQFLCSNSNAYNSGNNSNGFQINGSKKKLKTSGLINLQAKNILSTTDDTESSNNKNNSKTTAINSRSSISQFDYQNALDSLKDASSCSLNFQNNKLIGGLQTNFQGIKSNGINANKGLINDNSFNYFQSSLFLNNSNNHNINTNNHQHASNLLQTLQINQPNFSSPTYTQQYSFSNFNSNKQKNNMNEFSDNSINLNKQDGKQNIFLSTPNKQQLLENQDQEDEDLFNKETISSLWVKPGDLLAQTKQNLQMGEQKLHIDGGNLKQQLSKKLLGESSFHKKSSSFIDPTFTPSTMSHLNSNINLNNPNNFFDDDDKGERNSRGLRNLSLKVKQIVVQKGETSYKEVAEQLVEELRSQAQGQIKQEEIQKDEQNIKRRVYDALNVLIASKVIEKHGKIVKSCEKSYLNGRCLQAENWKNVKQIEADRDLKKETLKQKQKTLIEYTTKYLALMNLIERNKKFEQDKLNNQLSQQSVDFLNNQDQIQELSQRMNTIKEQTSLKDKILIDTEESTPNQTQQQQQLINVPNHVFKFPLILINIPSHSQETSKVIVKMSRDQKNGKFFSKSKMIVNADLDILLQMKMHKVDQKFMSKYLDQEFIQQYFMEKSYQQLQNEIENQNTQKQCIKTESINQSQNAEQLEQINIIQKKRGSHKICDDLSLETTQKYENNNKQINKPKKIKTNSTANKQKVQGKIKNNKNSFKNNLFDSENEIDLE